jgi:hypothetical protein
MGTQRSGQSGVVGRLHRDEQLVRFEVLRPTWRQTAGLALIAELGAAWETG